MLCVLLKSGVSELSGPIFTTATGARLSQNSVRNNWRRILSKAGIDCRKLHATRHTYASYMLASGADVTYVSKQLGHASIQMTVDIYSHLIPDRDRGMVNHLDGLFGQANRCSTNEKAP